MLGTFSVRSVLLGGVLCLVGAGLASGQVELQPKMGDPLPGLTPDQLLLFEAGKVLFDQTLEPADGLGPIFNKESCGNCHSVPTTGGPGTQTVTRFGLATKMGFDPLAELGGSLRQAAAIEHPTDPAESSCEEIVPAEANVEIQRITTSCFGIGLIEAIPDSDILFLQDNPPAGIAGTAHMVPAFEDPMGSPLRVGRFGWKAQVATVLTFSADASLNEMGLTNRFVMAENAPNGDETLLMECDVVADPEDGPDGDGFDFIDRVTHFQRFLAQPPQTPRSGMSGEGVFNAVGCADCHVASFTTADDPGLEDSIRDKTIRPYGDFLLHDMGTLGDGIVQGAGTELLMRTSPLWGLRTRAQILHDGRAGTLPGEDTLPGRVDRAIQEHDGEAAASRDAYNLLDQAEKDQLFAFLDSLGRAEFDFDGDNDIDETDFQAFVECFTGAGSFYTPDDSCSIGDVDQDGDVDMDDLDLFLLAYEGVNGTGDCNGNSTVDLVDIALGTSGDCNQNALPDECDIMNGDSLDGNGNGIPDECEQEFERGDCDSDGAVGLADAIFELNYLFQNGDTPSCRDACDLDDDGAIGINDPIYNLTFQFSGGPDPAAPYPGCGADPTPTNSLECVSSACP